MTIIQPDFGIIGENEILVFTEVQVEGYISEVDIF